MLAQGQGPSKLFGAMNALLQEVKRALHTSEVPQGAKLVVGASGGCDSTVLLHLLHELGHPLVVAHVNHSARGAQSDADERFVRDWAKQHNAPFECLTLEAEVLSSGNQGFQGEARKQRLSWMTSLCEAHEAHAVALGHHADDQAETWFLHALRSADPLSIMGMAIQDGRVLRPMLNLNRSDIRALAESSGWDWREDASNASSKYLRNRIRHELLPVLEDIKPGSIAHLQRLAGRARDLHGLLEPVLEDARAMAEDPVGSWSLKAMTQNPLALEALIRSLKKQGWSDASAQRVRTLLDAEVGQEVQHGSKRVIRDRHALTVASAKASSQAEVRIDLEQAGQGNVTTPVGTCTWQVSHCPETTSELHTERAWIPAHCLPATLRVWAHGDKIQPLGMEGHTKVSDVLTQAKTSTVAKEQALVLERLSDGCLLWVVGHKLAEQARIDVTTFAHVPGVDITFTPLQQT